MVTATLQFPTGGWSAEARSYRDREILVVELVARPPAHGTMTTQAISRPTLNFDVQAHADVYSVAVVGSNGSQAFTV